MAKRKTSWGRRILQLMFGSKQQLIEQNEEYRYIIEDLELMNELERQSTGFSDKVGALWMAQVLLAHYTDPKNMEQHLTHILSTMPLDLRAATLTYLDELRENIERELNQPRNHLRLVNRQPPEGS